MFLKTLCVVLCASLCATLASAGCSSENGCRFDFKARVWARDKYDPSPMQVFNYKHLFVYDDKITIFASPNADSMEDDGEIDQTLFLRKLDLAGIIMPCLNAKTNQDHSICTAGQYEDRILPIPEDIMNAGNPLFLPKNKASEQCFVLPDKPDPDESSVFICEDSVDQAQTRMDELRQAILGIMKDKKDAISKLPSDEKASDTSDMDDIAKLEGKVWWGKRGASQLEPIWLTAYPTRVSAYSEKHKKETLIMEYMYETVELPFTIVSKDQDPTLKVPPVNKERQPQRRDCFTIKSKLKKTVDYFCVIDDENGKLFGNCDKRSELWVETLNDLANRHLEIKQTADGATATSSSNAQAAAQNMAVLKQSINALVQKVSKECQRQGTGVEECKEKIADAVGKKVLDLAKTDKEMMRKLQAHVESIVPTNGPVNLEAAGVKTDSKERAKLDEAARAAAMENKAAGPAAAQAAASAAMQQMSSGELSEKQVQEIYRAAGNAAKLEAPFPAHWVHSSIMSGGMAMAIEAENQHECRANDVRPKLRLPIGIDPWDMRSDPFRSFLGEMGRAALAAPVL